MKVLKRLFSNRVPYKNSKHDKNSVIIKSKNRSQVNIRNPIKSFQKTYESNHTWRLKTVLVFS